MNYSEFSKDKEQWKLKWRFKEIKKILVVKAKYICKNVEPGQVYLIDTSVQNKCRLKESSQMVV